MVSDGASFVSDGASSSDSFLLEGAVPLAEGALAFVYMTTVLLLLLLTLATVGALLARGAVKRARRAPNLALASVGGALLLASALLVQIGGGGLSARASSQVAHQQYERALPRAALRP